MADPSSPPSIWVFMASWFTPTCLFLFLNLMIGIIVLTSRLGSNKKPQQENHRFVRAPSLLERVKSIDFSIYKFPPRDMEAETETTMEFEQHVESEHATRVEPPQLERTPSLLERVKSIKLASFYRSDPEPKVAAEPEVEPYEDTGHIQGSDSAMEHHVRRSKSEPRVDPGRQAPEKMKKSASEKLVGVELDEEEEDERVEQRRPATTRLEKKVSFGDDGVDAKADDFINKFKQQLRLQRLDSLLRYRDMLKGKQM